MIVYVYPADPYGCGYYRLAYPARAAREAGADVRLVMPSDRVGIGGEVDTRTGRLVNLKYPPDADVIVLQRVAMTTLAQAIPQLRARGVAVVVDMDDDLTKIDPNNPAFSGFRVNAASRGARRADPLLANTASGSALHNREYAHQACLDATLVTVSSPPLLRTYAPHGRGLVLENRVPAAYLDIPRVDSATVGWAGSVHSHPGDLLPLGPAIQRLIRAGVEYWGVGPNYHLQRGDGGLARALGVMESEADAIETAGDIGFAEWPLAVATLGTGLAPLADTDFNAAKSWLKPLEYMACGVPWIASPRAEYVKLHRRTGVGVLAKDPKDWYRLALRASQDRAWRLEQSAAGQAAVLEHGLTYEASAWRWIEAWEHALKLQRG